MGYLEYGSLSMMQGGIINQDWLDEAGLDVPVTYDDMYETLTAFKSNGHPGALLTTCPLQEALASSTRTVQSSVLILKIICVII